jgi:prophage regulatory protein
MSKDRQPAEGTPLHAKQLADALLCVKQVGDVTSFSPATTYRKVAEGTFPQPIRFGKRCTRWRASDIAAWLAALGENA